MVNGEESIVKPVRRLSTQKEAKILLSNILNSYKEKIRNLNLPPVVYCYWVNKNKIRVHKVEQNNIIYPIEYYFRLK